MSSHASPADLKINPRDFRIDRTASSPRWWVGGERRIPFLKAYTVFNVEQIDGLPEAYAPTPPLSLIHI